VEELTVALVTTAAMGAAQTVGGEAGQSAWSSMVGLVRRALRRGSDWAPDRPEEPDQDPDTVVDPEDEEQVRAWAEEVFALALRDEQFMMELRAWVMEHSKEDAIPRQVPPPVRDVVDREPLRDQLKELVEDDAQRRMVHLVVLTGVLGVGRRSVVRQIAHESGGRKRFPGGQIHVEFSRWRNSQGEVDMVAVLRSCLRSLKVDERYLPQSLPELADRLRDCVKGPCLVVLEDASRPAEVRPFIPHVPGSMVMVTTHVPMGELVLDGALPLRVKPLDTESALLMLGQRCGAERMAAEPDAARRLVEWCGRLPLALDILAARLQLHADEPLSTLVDELADEATRLDALRISAWEERTMATTLNIVRRDLPAPLRECYDRLGLFPGPEFDARVVAAVADVCAPRGRDMLAHLDQVGLVEPASAGRFRFPELVHLHARRCGDALPSEIREAVAARIIRLYHTRTAFADRAVTGVRTRITDLDALLSGQTDPFVGTDEDENAPKPKALRWLMTERPNILAVQR
jgi:hypothetical protein